MKKNDMQMDDILLACENLEYLNQFAGRLRETEYRILLIICGHTRHGKVPIHQVKPILDEYWHSVKCKVHLKNIHFVLNRAINKIKTEVIYLNFNTLS